MRKLLTALAMLVIALGVKAAPIANSLCASGRCPLCK